MSFEIEQLPPETENNSENSSGEEIYKFLEDSTQPVRNVVAWNSILEIGNKVDIKGEVILMPEGNNLPKAAEEVLNSIRNGDIKPKQLVTEDKEKAICGDFVSRSDWKAAKPNCNFLKYDKVPILAVVYQTEKHLCKTCKECTEQVKNLQKYQQKPRSLSRATVRPAPACDIQYNFLVGGNGVIYEGRGYSVQGEMPDSFQNQTLILAFMGTFVVTYPENIQLTNAEAFLEEAAKNGYLDPDYRVAGAMDIRNSDSPGCKLNQQLKLWRRYTNDPLTLLKTSRTRNETNADLCFRTPPTPGVRNPYY